MEAGACTVCERVRVYGDACEVPCRSRLRSRVHEKGVCVRVCALEQPTDGSQVHLMNLCQRASGGGDCTSLVGVGVGVGVGVESWRGACVWGVSASVVARAN